MEKSLRRQLKGKKSDLTKPHIGIKVSRTNTRAKGDMMFPNDGYRPRQKATTQV